uniref:YagK/YfjJ C-terminal domain-containing protein n=1 Tax=Thiomonas intermedia (strain K12) TaxID=75379 RepID=D5WYT7_THIK1
MISTTPGAIRSTEEEGNPSEQIGLEHEGIERAQMADFENQIEREMGATLRPLWLDLPHTPEEMAVMSEVMADVSKSTARLDRPTRQHLWDAARQLGTMQKMTQMLSRTEGDLFRLYPDEWGFYVQTYRPLASRLQLLLSKTEPRVRQIFPLCELEPHVEVFLDSFKPLLGVEMESRFATHAHGEDYVRKLNQGVQRVREQVRSEAFGRKLESRIRGVDKNAKSLRDYIDALHAAYGKLLAVRIDLSYKNAGQINRPGGPREETAQAIKDRDQFFRELKKQPFAEHYLGYVWKMEYGLFRGPHFHVLLFFDGAKVRQDGLFAKLAGNLWVKITQGRGDYYNCNAHKERYGNALGIGMVNRSDLEKRALLQVAASYLVKVDYVRRLTLEGAYRTFGRGEVSEAIIRRQPDVPDLFKSSTSQGG